MNTMTDDNPKLRIIRGLLAQAEDPACTPEEAETYAAKAEQLMVKYAIDSALLDASRPDTKATPGKTRLDIPGGYAMPKAGMLTLLGEAFGVTVVVATPKGQTPYAYLVGYPTDVTAVETLYTSLLLQGANAMGKESRTDRAFRNAFWHLFAATTGTRVVTERKEAVQRAEAQQRAEQTDSRVPSTSAATLVLADRGRDVAAYARKEFPDMRVRRPSYSDGDGARAGRRAGEAANLGQRGQVHGGRTALSA